LGIHRITANDPANDNAQPDDACGGKPEPNKNDCLNACSAGATVIESLCRQFTSAQTRAKCWAISRGSEEECIGFCDELFSN